MTVRTRLVLTFILIGVLLVVPALFAARGLTSLRDLAVENRSRHAEAAVAVGHVEAGLAELDQAVRAYVATGAAQLREAPYRTLRSLEFEVSRIESAGYLEAAPPLRQALGVLRAEVETIDILLAAGALTGATERVESFEIATTETRDRLAELATGVDLRAQADFEQARSIGVATLRTTILVLAAAVALSILLSAWTTRALTHPLRQLRRALARVTEGDFEAPPDLPYERHDEIGDLAVSFGTMSRRLAELDRLKAEFLGVASHELKTPINVIRGYTELIEEEVAGDLTEHQREIMQRIGEQTQLLTRQVSRLMDISRLETGSYLVEPEGVLLSDLIMGVERSFEIVAREKGLTFSTSIAEDAPKRLIVDVDLIRDEVLGNLVSNALKFTPAGGTVSLNARGDEDGVMIEVSDTGPGIEGVHRGHIFEKYYQVERSRAVGAGLGLAIAREMAIAHGGDLELVDADGPGATFRVYLPVDGSRIRREVKVGL